MGIVIVGGVIEKDGKFLLVQEAQEKCRGKWNIPAGHLDPYETIFDGAKREIKEELGKDIEIKGYIATVENFFKMKEAKYHEIMFVHKIEFTEKEDQKIEYTMKNIEGKDYLQYEWIELKKIDEYPLLPEVIKEILKENKFPTHKINNDLK